MARLIVLRGETPDRSVDLVRLPARIGRGQKNDIVLDDPMKGISRDHAEIRLVDDRYVLVDLESENGIWVSGRRVPEVVLGPNVVASIGPFRLTISDEAAAVLPESPVARPVRPSPPPSTPATPKPRASTAAAPKPAAGSASQQKWLLGGIAAAVVIVAVAAMMFLSQGPEQVAVVETPDVSGPIAEAERQAGQGLCTEALSTIAAALQRYPNNADLISARVRAEGCVPVATTPQPPPFDAAAELQAARDLLTARDCPAAMARIDAVLAAQPDSFEGEQLRKQATAACSGAPPSTPGPAPVRKPAPAVEIAAENGGLTPLPNELDSDYQVRVKAMRDRYDEAVAAAAKGPSPAVVTTYEGILRDTSPRYLDVAARLAEARKGMAGAARSRIKEAEDLEAKERWNEALARLTEAKRMDSTLAIDDAVARIEKKKIARGEEECRQGRQSTNYGRHSEAAQHYDRVLQLLPKDHPCYETAQRNIGSSRR